MLLSRYVQQFPEHFFVAPRLQDKSVQLIETANDYHYGDATPQNRHLSLQKAHRH